MVAMIAKLYQIERSAKEMTPEERREIRQAQAKPLLEKIKACLDGKAGKVLPKSLLGKAIHYGLGLWPQLVIYVEDGNIPHRQQHCRECDPTLRDRSEKLAILRQPSRRACQHHALFADRDSQGKQTRAMGLPVRETAHCKIGAGDAGPATAKCKNGRHQQLGSSL